MTSTYNGYKNYETWNVSLWFQNDEAMYEFAKSCQSYDQFMDAMMMGSTTTPDGVAWNDKTLDYDKLDEIIESIS